MKVTDEKGNTVDIPDGIWEATVKEYATKPSWPQNGDEYWVIRTDGDVYAARWANDVLDTRQLEYGIYRTREEAEKVVAKRKAEATIRYFIAENGLEFEPDWADESQSKYYIYYNKINEWGSHWRVNTNLCHPFYFANESDAQKVITNCEKELAILFGVKEEGCRD